MQGRRLKHFSSQLFAQNHFFLHHLDLVASLGFLVRRTIRDFFFFHVGNEIEKNFAIAFPHFVHFGLFFLATRTATPSLFIPYQREFEQRNSIVSLHVDHHHSFFHLVSSAPCIVVHQDRIVVAVSVHPAQHISQAKLFHQFTAKITRSHHQPIPLLSYLFVDTDQIIVVHHQFFNLQHLFFQSFSLVWHLSFILKQKIM